MAVRMSKIRDFSKLAGAVSGQPNPASSPDSAPPVSLAKRGRPVVETEPFQLRIPRSLLQQLVRASAEESVAKGRNVTPQQVALRILMERFDG